MYIDRVPKPTLSGPSDILIRVQYAGVNRPDLLQRMGHYDPPPGASPILGLEVAGEVAEAGASAGYRLGDRVCALVNGGGYCEYVACPASQALPFPAGFNAKEAAAIPETFFTVWANLFMLGKLRARETALIHGGSSGIGITAVALCKAFDVRSIVTVGSDHKCDELKKFGADLAVNYKSKDFLEEAQRFTADSGGGVDVVLDIVGADYFARNLKALRMDGRLLLVGFMSGSQVPQVDLRAIMMKRLHVTGSTMRARTTAEKAEIAAELRKNVWPLLESGRCQRLPIAAVFPLEQVAEAHRLVESSTHIGKVLLKVAE